MSTKSLVLVMVMTIMERVTLLTGGDSKVGGGIGK